MTTVQSLKKEQTRQLRLLKAGTRLSIFMLLPLVAVLYISTSSYDQRSTSHVISRTSSQSNKQRTTHTTSTTDLAEALLEGKKESILQKKKKEEAKHVAGKKESSHHKAEKEHKKDQHHKSHKEKDYWKEMMENYNNSTLALPLRPPFRVWAFGQPRTGSTFLLHLLDAIAVFSLSSRRVFVSSQAFIQFRKRRTFQNYHIFGMLPKISHFWYVCHIYFKSSVPVHNFPITFKTSNMKSNKLYLYFLSTGMLLPLVAVLYISTSSYDQRSTSHVISRTSSQSNKQRTTHTTTTTDLAEALLEGKKESILQKKKEEAKHVAVKKESSHHKAEKENKKDQHHKSHKEKDYWKVMMENYNSTLELPLRPPFRVWAFGQPRTGSTFLLHLLDAIVSVKSPPDSKVFFSGFQKNSHAGRHWYENDSFVIRSHVPPHYYNEKSKARKVFEEGKVAIFTSLKNDGKTGKIWHKMSNHALYTQHLENMITCSTCEVDKYKDIFNMTDGEVKRVKDYMETYEIIRRCCGMQMSKWEMKRLHGCNITEEHKKRPDYPHCELINKQTIEKKLADNVGGIVHHAQDDPFNWKQVGDCKKFDDKIIAGKGFNGDKFMGCDADSLEV